MKLEIDADRITITPNIVRTFEPRTILRSEVQAVGARRFGPAGNIQFILATGETLPVEFGYLRLGPLLGSLERWGWPIRA